MYVLGTHLRSNDRSVIIIITASTVNITVNAEKNSR